MHDDFTASFLQGKTRQDTGLDPVLVFQARPRLSAEHLQQTSLAEDSVVSSSEARDRTYDQAKLAAEYQHLSRARVHEPHLVENKRTFLVFNNCLPVTSQNIDGETIATIPQGQNRTAAVVAAVHQRQFVPRGRQEVESGALKRLVVYDKPLCVVRDETVDEIVSREHAAQIEFKRFGKQNGRSTHTRKLASLTSKDESTYLDRIRMLKQVGPRDFFRDAKDDNAKKAEIAAAEQLAAETTPKTTETEQDIK